MRRIASALVLSFACAACLPFPIADDTTVKVPAILPRVASSRPIVVLPMQDLRPAALTKTHFAQSSDYTGFATPVISFGSGRADGPEMAGDSAIWVRMEGTKGHPEVVPAIDDYFGTVFTRVFGTSLTRSTSAVKLDDVRASGSAASGGEGIVVVPLLDSFDYTRLSSEDSITGGSSSTSGNTTTTTSGSASATSTTAKWGNVRVRLVLLDVRGGAVARESVAYVAATRGYVSEALEEAAKVSSIRLASFVEGPSGGK